MQVTVARGTRSTARRRAFLVAALLGFIGALPAEAADPFGGLLKGIAPSAKSKAKADPAQPAEAGAMNMNEPTAAPPLRGLGTDAVAVVEDVTGTTAVQSMDYVFAKQAIELGAKGKLTLSYLSGCLTEVIEGGTVTVALSGSAVAGGQRTASETPDCKAATPVILAEASEAGATVNRVTPFSAGNWNERALKSAEPVFKWDKALGPVTVRVKDMEKDGEPVVWQGAADKDWIAYPADGAPLAVGLPFRVEAMAGERVVAGALFSIDPALDVADNLANRIVPLSAP